MKRKLTPLELEIKALEKDINLTSIRPNIPKALEGRFGRMSDLDTGKEYILPLAHWSERKYHLIQEVDSRGAAVAGETGVPCYPEVEDQGKALAKDNKAISKELEDTKNELSRLKEVAEKLAQENEELKAELEKRIKDSEELSKQPEKVNKK